MSLQSVPMFPLGSEILQVPVAKIEYTLRVEKECITRMALGRTLFGNRKGGGPAKESRRRIVLNLLSREYWGWGRGIGAMRKG